MMKDGEDPEASLLYATDGDDDDAGAPASLICPITQELLVEPVIAADGFTYERAAIERWLGMGPQRRSPTTNAPLASRHLTPNRTLASMIVARGNRRPELRRERARGRPRPRGAGTGAASARRSRRRSAATTRTPRSRP